MKLTIFGATGMVGKELIKQALLNDHYVNAFGRNVFAKPMPKHDNLNLIQGALFDEQQVYDAVKGVDAVLSAIGGAMDGTDKTRSLGMKNIIAQMEKAGVKRIVALGGMGVLENENGILLDQPDYPEEYIPVGKEHYEAYTLLKNSSLEFTFVGAPNIVQGEATGLFYTAANTLPTPNNYAIFSGDVSLFMLQELKHNRYINQRVGISN